MTGRWWPRPLATHSCVRIARLYFGLEARRSTQFVERVLLSGLPRLTNAPLRYDRTLHCRRQALDQGLLFKRFTHKANRACVHGSAAVFLVWVSGNKNYRRATALRLQPLLQVEAIQARHLEVGNEAARCGNGLRLKKILSRS